MDHVEEICLLWPLALALVLALSLAGRGGPIGRGAGPDHLWPHLSRAHPLPGPGALNRAERDGAELVILRLNTPGGQIDIIDQIVGAHPHEPHSGRRLVAPRRTAGSAGAVSLPWRARGGHGAGDGHLGAASPVGGQGENLDDARN